MGKNFFRKLFGKKKKEKQRIVIRPEDVGMLDKAVEFDRAYQRGLLAAEKLKSAKLEQKIAPPKINVSKELAEEEKKLKYEPYIGAFSWKNFFKLFRKKKNWKKYKVVSHDFKKIFGTFYDIIALKDGRWALIIKTPKGTIEPLITGRTVKELFKNFRGLNEGVSKKLFVVNLDENGRFIENILEREISPIIIDGKGKYVFSKVSTIPFTEILAEKESVINELLGDIETYEEIIRKQETERNLLRIGQKYSESRAESSDAILQKTFKNSAEMMRAYSNVVSENVILAQEKVINKEMIDKLEKVKEKLLEATEEEEGKLTKQKAVEDLQRVLDWAKGMLPEYIEKPAPTPAPTETALGRRFEEKMR